jgi:O-antigen ligase
VNKKTTIFIATLGMFTILVASLYGISSITRGEGVVYDFYVKESGLARPMVWNMAKGASVARPLLGYGNENFEYVYQHNLDIKIMRLENPEWFDKVHNLILDELVNTGYVGLSAMFIIFCLVCYLSFRYYLREGKFYFLIIPFIFIFNFLQTQTFF